MDKMAEADGNRTRLAEMLGHIGVEDRARHQTRYASTGIVGRAPPEHRTAPSLSCGGCLG